MKSAWVNSIATVFLTIFICSSVWAKGKKENQTQLLISTHEKVVKGFPVILKIKTVGLQRVPRMSLFGRQADVEIIFTCEKDGKKHTISPPRQGYDMVFAMRGGEATGHIPRQVYQISLKPGEKRTKLLDMASVMRYGKGVTLSNIPPGKYTVSMKFSSLGKTSNEIRVEIVKPSETENNYLLNLRKSGIPLGRENEIIWSQLLLNHSSIPEKGLSKLSTVAQDQLCFHVLLSKVGQSNALSSKDINSLKVTDFLRPEKECLQLQLDEVSEDKGDLEKKKKAFAKRYPGLIWRLKNSRQEETGFLFPWRLKK